MDIVMMSTHSTARAGSGIWHGFGESTLRLGSMLTDGQVGRLRDRSAVAMSTFENILPVQVLILNHEWSARRQSFVPDLVSAAKTSETICENCMAILKAAMPSRAMELFKEMKIFGGSPDSIAICSMFSEFSQHGSV
ncbi:hypothetical protein Syun_004205 [Stephania yunnanensis]|uniref:Pentatricopeptide repeat-containing protein n=1 Tax=Stephania yunnanensis TaxID=152371 RepID=A0AAP0L2L2_9MAGN